MTREGEIDPLGRIGGQRYACAKQYRHEGNFNCIDQFRFGETPKKGTAPKQPDVFSGARFQCGQHLQLILGHDSNIRILFRPQGSREDDRFDTRHCSATCRSHGFEGLAAHDDGVELSE